MLLRVLSGTQEVSNGKVVYDMSLNKDAFNYEINRIGNKAVDSKGANATISTMSDENKARIKDIVDGINTFFIPNTKVESIAEQEFAPYMEDKDSFDNCLKSLKQKLELYINE